MALEFSKTAIAISVASIVVPLVMMDFFKRKNKFDVDGKTVLITGGSSGMGRSVARMLAEKGANVIIVARDLKKLEEAKAHIKASAVTSQDQIIHTISSDLSKASNCEDVFAEATRVNNGSPPDIVWCVAGSAIPKYFIEATTDELQHHIDSDYFSTAYMAHATLRQWLKPSSNTSYPPNFTPDARHLIFTSSVVAFYSIAGYSPYAPAKAALRTLADTLRQEVLVYNGSREHTSGNGPAADVKVHAVFPNTIFGPSFDKENLTKPDVTKMLEDGDPGQTADEVAASSIKALEKGEYLITGVFLGSAMRAGAFSGSPRNNWLRDTLFAWLINLVWLFIGPDLDGKAWKWGRDHGHPALAQKKA